MTRFSFVHAADLHLGSPLTGLANRDADVAARFAAAGRRAFEDLVGRAIADASAFVVVAGDVYDGDWTDATIGLFFARQCARLERAGIPVFLVRGNHDAESVVTRSVTLPANVREFPTARADTLRIDSLRVALHGRGFAHRAVTENLALTYPQAVPGWFNLGVLHTSCAGAAGHAPYAPCTVADLAARGYDYWALGHVHEYAELSREPWIVFPGNLQGRSVRECGAKGAVAVDVADGRVTAVRRLVLDHARFHLLDVDLADVSEFRDLGPALARALAPLAPVAAGRLVALRVRLIGETAIHDALSADRESLTAEVQAACHRVHEDIWLERVRVETRRPRGPGGQAPVASALDPDALMAGLDRDPEFRARARALLGEIGQRTPVGLEDHDLSADLDALVAEAEGLIRARLDGRGC